MEGHSICSLCVRWLNCRLRAWGAPAQAMVNDDVNVRCVRISDTVYDLTLLSASGTPILSVPKYEIVPLP